MRRWILTVLLAIVLMTGCGAHSGDSQAPPAVVSPTPRPSPTDREPTAVPSPTPTATVAPPPCDPRAADFCIVAGHFVLQRPITPPGNDWVDASYRYGYTQDETREPHHGVEFPNPQGTPVLAAADGTVVFAGSDAAALVGPLTGFYGNVIVLEHHLPEIEETVFTLYAHLSRIDVSLGQTVAAGERIGAVGLTGIAVGSHLHFEVRLGSNDYRSTRNPELWLLPRLDETGQPYGTLALRVADGYGHTLSVFPVLQYFPERSGAPTWEVRLEPYPHETLNADDVWGENFALGSLAPGWYRISFIQMGGLYERWVEIQPGKLTVAVFEIAP